VSVSAKTSKVETPSPGESAWETRIDWVAAQSKRVFAGRPGYSGEWLCTPNPLLDGSTPLQAVATDSGFRTVQEVLAKIERGIYA
jgi:uncharacterized protein (DUF2384 family)